MIRWDGHQIDPSILSLIFAAHRFLPISVFVIKIDGLYICVAIGRETSKLLGKAFVSFLSNNFHKGSFRASFSRRFLTSTNVFSSKGSAPFYAALPLVAYIIGLITIATIYNKARTGMSTEEFLTPGCHRKLGEQLNFTGRNRFHHQVINIKEHSRADRPRRVKAGLGGGVASITNSVDK